MHIADPSKDCASHEDHLSGCITHSSPIAQAKFPAIWSNNRPGGFFHRAFDHAAPIRYTDRSEREIIVDRNIRHENLLPELCEVFSQLGIPFDGKLGVAAKSEYRTDRRPYREIFNEEQRAIVERAFAKEIELHGYRV